MTVGLVIAILIFSFVLIKAADFVVVALRRLGRTTHTGAFTISAFLLALSTSFPEFFVGVTSALSDTPNLSLGNVLGANIANVSLVAGVSAIIGGSLLVHGEFLHRDIFIAFLAGLAPIVLIFDRTLSRVDGLILIALYGVYASSLFREKFEEIARQHQEEGFWYRFLRRFKNLEGEVGKELGRLFLGVALLLFSADMIVRFAKLFAEAANIPVFLVGLIILSVGTTLPEIAFSIRTIEDRVPTMFFGNILGSIIANSTLIIGVVAVLSPIHVVARRDYLLAALAFIIVFGLFWFLIRTKHRLDRWEAVVLFGGYLAFVALELSGFNPFTSLLK